jgi:signal transduction histidine kinase
MTGDAGERATILVAEDDRINRLVLVRGVEREGHRVVEAADGREALAHLADGGVDMVLLDLLMPAVDGFDVLRAMATEPELREIPVLVISAVEASDEVARALEMGAIDCLPKPVDPVLLRVRLHTALEQARLRRLEQDYLRQELALRQQERLVTLGRLSAGLGHELNNPAAAALSTTRQLGAALDDADRQLAGLLNRTDAGEVVAAVGRLAATAAPPTDDAERDERQDVLEDVLGAAGIADPWDLAADLAGAGVEPAAVARTLTALGDAAGVALPWLATRTRIRRAIDQITTSVRRMAELTSALRSYSYLDRAPQQEVDVRSGLDDTLTILQHKVPEGVTIVREYAPDLPTIPAYGGQLNQVWTNLIDNALDALADGGTLQVRVHARPDAIVVEVEDDGPGIAPEVAGSIFDPFVTTKPPGEGTGLGLAISHQLVTDAQGGSLRMRSAPGATVFEVTLPRTGPPAPEHRAEEDPDVR